MKKIMMPKLLSAIVFLQFLDLNGVAQGTSSLYVSKFAVGIGTNSPTAQLHTTGSLRFTGIANNDQLSNVLVQDASGNVFYRSASTISPNNVWFTTGNAGTNPAYNFLGTTDYQRLGFRTNNIERFTIMPSGNTGINTSDPAHLLTTVGVSPEANAEIWVQQSAGSSLGAYLTLDNRANLGGQGWSIGSTGSLNFPTVAGALEFYQFGVGTRMLIDAQGRMGLGLAPANMPTANFHTRGSVRLQNLPSGTGNVVVIDSDGNLYRSSFTARIGTTTQTSTEVASLKTEIEQLKQELSELKRQINELTK